MTIITASFRCSLGVCGGRCARARARFHRFEDLGTMRYRSGNVLLLIHNFASLDRHSRYFVAKAMQGARPSASASSVVRERYASTLSFYPLIGRARSGAKKIATLSEADLQQFLEKKVLAHR